MNIKTTITLRIICLIIIIVLGYAIYTHGKTLSCNKCVVNFETQRQNGLLLEKPRIITVTLEDLYIQLKNKTCIVKWDNEQGYYIA